MKRRLTKMSNETKRMCTAKRIVQQLFLSVVFITIIIICIFTIFQLNDDIIGLKEFEDLDNDVLLGDFLLDSENCKIPNISPFSKEAMKEFRGLPYKKCHKLAPLTSVEVDILIISEEHKKDYLSWWHNEIKCCYQRITRSGVNKTADSQYKLSECKDFVSGHVLDNKDEFILVTCSSLRNTAIVRKFETEVYKNAHAIVMPKIEVEEKLKASTNNNSSFNVLLIGIDSISRLNFIRAMPKTCKYLKDRNWYDMKVFNKIGYNTFPNLMAILTGLNSTTAGEKCNWKNVGELEKCKFLWNDFDDANFITAYAEDSMQLTTFNYYRTGFIKQPTDYYFRPFGLAAEDNLKRSYEKLWLSKCLGYQHYGDYVYQYALDFAKKYKNDSFFGLFWTNSFSHDDLSAPSEYDDRMKYYLEQLESEEILDNTIVMFFSDHGMRFGGIRKYFTGWLEERMPFLYFWLPKSFEIKYPEFAENLKINENRLVSPYDIHVTMKHILMLESKYDGEINAESCETCQSLFYEVAHNRSCNDAGISDVWCTCQSFNETDHKSDKVRRAAIYAVDKLNNELAHLNKCAKLKLNTVSSARESKHGSTTDYMISFDVLPSKGHMEATIRCSNECKKTHLIGEISRVDRYGNQSWCISDSHLRQYCFCQ